jgi:hypothetical protein
MAKAGRKKKEEVSDSSVVTIEVPQTDTITNPEFTDITTTTITLKDDELTTLTENVEKEEYKMPEVFIPQRRMSEQALKWEKYIAMYNFTPETFLERYPNHVNKRFIEEIIAFKKREKS